LLALLISTWFASSARAASTPQQITFTATTSWVEVSALPQIARDNLLVIENYTDGDIEIAFKSTDYPDFIVKQNTDKIIDVTSVLNPSIGIQIVGKPMYIRSLTGTGGPVYVRTMPVGSVTTTGRAAGSGGGQITPVAPGGAAFQQLFLSAASTQINDNAAAWVAVGSSLTAAAQAIHVTTTIGEPLQFASGTDCTAPSLKFYVNRGEGPLVIGVQIGSGDVLCVRSLTALDVNSGEVVVNLMKAP